MDGALALGLVHLMVGTVIHIGDIIITIGDLLTIDHHITDLTDLIDLLIQFIKIEMV